MFEKGTIRFTEATSEYVVFEREDKELGLKAVIIMNRSKKKITRDIREFAGMRSFCVAHGKELTGKVSVEPFGYAVVFVK